ncbi:MAG: metallophosphoesterase [Bacteroidia bacterium]|nr:metallophosphoesterase [Bacteroidia bacterium]
MRRKDFLLQSLMAVGALPLAKAEKLFPAFNDRDDAERLIILYTNDQHSRIDPFPDDHPTYAGKGGFAQRAAVIEEIRKQNKQVLLLDAGDIFQGTPYFNFFHGKPELQLMTAMKYDASTFGNHDFDLGIENLVEVLPHAGFHFLNCNYDFSDTPLHAHQKIKRYTTLKMGRMKIGLTGVGINLDGLVPGVNRKGLRFLDTVAELNKIASILKNELHCHLVICLSHLGYKYKNRQLSDEIIARESEHLDVIIGGHTHTFLEQASIFENKKGRPVYVCQAGWAGIWLGVLEILYSPYKKITIFANLQREILSQ